METRALLIATCVVAGLSLAVAGCSDCPCEDDAQDTGTAVDTSGADDTGAATDTATDPDTSVDDVTPDTDDGDADAGDADAGDTDAGTGDAADASTDDTDAGGEDTTDEDTTAADTGGDTADADTADTALDTSEDTSEDTDVALPPGEYELRVQVTAADDAVSSYLMDPDAGAWNMFSGETVYFGRRGTDPHVSYHTALRFAAVEVPAGAEILEATLSLNPHNSVDRSRALALNIYAERQAASAPIDPANYDANRPDQRLRTRAFIDGWVVRCADPCNDAIEYDCEQRIADCWASDTRYVVPKGLAELVAEVIAIDGWESGNPLTFLVVNRAGDSDDDLGRYNDARALYGFDADAPDTAPELYVRYRIE